MMNDCYDHERIANGRAEIWDGHEILRATRTRAWEFGTVLHMRYVWFWSCTHAQCSSLIVLSLHT